MIGPKKYKVKVKFFILFLFVVISDKWAMGPLAESILGYTYSELSPVKQQTWMRRLKRATSTCFTYLPERIF